MTNQNSTGLCSALLKLKGSLIVYGHMRFRVEIERLGHRIDLNIYQSIIKLLPPQTSISMHSPAPEDRGRGGGVYKSHVPNLGQRYFRLCQTWTNIVLVYNVY